MGSEISFGPKDYLGSEKRIWFWKNNECSLALQFNPVFADLAYCVVADFLFWDVKLEPSCKVRSFPDSNFKISY